MLAVVTVRLSGSETITAPFGWTLIRRDGSTSGAALSQVLLFRVATALEPAFYTWTFSSTAGATGGISAFGGVDVLSPVDGQAGALGANKRLITAPSITTGLDGSLVLGLFGNSAQSSMTAPTGMAEDFDITNQSLE